jgi:hypothetical protein
LTISVETRQRIADFRNISVKEKLLDPYTIISENQPELLDKIVQDLDPKETNSVIHNWDKEI